jgi:hypothetical protein
MPNSGRRTRWTQSHPRSGNKKELLLNRIVIPVRCDFEKNYKICRIALDTFYYGNCIPTFGFKNIHFIKQVSFPRMNNFHEIIYSNVCILFGSFKCLATNYAVAEFVSF